MVISLLLNIANISSVTYIFIIPEQVCHRKVLGKKNRKPTNSRLKSRVCVGISSITSKLYFSMVMVTILLLVLDIFSRFDGNPETIYTLFNYSGNFLVFLLSPLLPSLWLLYVHLQLFDDEKKTKKKILPLITLYIQRF